MGQQKMIIFFRQSGSTFLSTTLAQGPIAAAKQSKAAVVKFHLIHLLEKGLIFLCSKNKE